MKNFKSTKKIAIMGVMTAISIILIYIIRFPIIPAAPFLEYEPGDIPIYIIAFLYGPLSGLVITIIASLIQGITVSAGSGIIGIIMHIFATGTFVLVAGSIYNMKKNRVQQIIALTAGVAAMTIAMCIWNILFTPMYMGVPREVVIDMLIPVIIPFNLIKSGINSIVTLLLFNVISGIYIKIK